MGVGWYGYQLGDMEGLERHRLPLAMEDSICSFTLPPIAGRACEISVMGIILPDSI
jgi:hypothetical protein